MAQVTLTLPYKPEGIQQDFYNLNTRFTIGRIGRQWGKSLISMLRGIKRSEPNGIYYWVEPTIPQAKIHMKRMKKYYKHFISNVNLTDRIITLKTGGDWHFKGADDPENLEGDTINGLIADEAAKYKPEVWTGTLRPMLAVNRGWADFIGKPRGNNWYKQLWMQALEDPENWSTFHAVSDTSPFFSTEEMDEARRTTPDRVFRQEYEAEFIDDQGEVFRNFRQCVTGQFVPPNYEGRYQMGVDLAKLVDWTVLTVIDLETRHVVAHERFNNIDWSFQEERIAALAQKYDALIKIDSTGVGDPVFERLNKRSLRIKGVKFTNTIKNHMVESLAMILEKRELTFPEIPELLNELSLFIGERSPSGNMIYGAPTGYHDDCVTSLMLACDGITRKKLKARPM